MTTHEQQGALASPEWLAQHLNDDDIVVVEVSGMGPADVEAYGKGHIPGALHWRWQEMLWDPAKRDFPTPEAFALRMAGQGISPDTTVVIYGEDIQFGSYAWWALRYCGHAKVKLLDGARAAWQARGLPLETGRNEPARQASYEPRARHESMRALREQVLAQVEAGGDIIDARAPEEYSGERVAPFGMDDHGAVLHGRIPGARHLFYRDLVDGQNQFKDTETLRRMLQAGEHGEGTIMVYCRMSHRASFVYFALTELLGVKDVQLYDGSWTEWGSLVGYPIELGPTASGA